MAILFTFTNSQTFHSMKDKHLAIRFGRIIIGVSFLGHGIQRIPHITSFSDHLMQEFALTWIPNFIIKPFSLMLPLIEFILGIALVFGWWKRNMYIAGIILMMVLMLGCCVLGKWSLVGMQMFYGAWFCVLMYFLNSPEAVSNPVVD